MTDTVEMIARGDAWHRLPAGAQAALVARGKESWNSIY